MPVTLMARLTERLAQALEDLARRLRGRSGVRPPSRASRPGPPPEVLAQDIQTTLQAMECGDMKSRRPDDQAKAGTAGLERPPPPEMDVSLARGEPGQPRPLPPPGEDGDLPPEFEFVLKQYESQHSGRQAYRVPVMDLFVSLAQLKGRRVPLGDISVLGMRTFWEGPKPRIGGTATVDILTREGQPVVRELRAKVMRHDAQAVGWRFIDLDRPREDALYKLVLAEQKKMADRKKRFLERKAAQEAAGVACPDPGQPPAPAAPPPGRKPPGARTRR